MEVLEALEEIKQSMFKSIDALASAVNTQLEDLKTKIINGEMTIAVSPKAAIEASGGVRVKSQRVPYEVKFDGGVIISEVTGQATFEQTLLAVYGSPCVSVSYGDLVILSTETPHNPRLYNKRGDVYIRRGLSINKQIDILSFLNDIEVVDLR